MRGHAPNSQCPILDSLSRGACIVGKPTKDTRSTLPSSQLLDRRRVRCSYERVFASAACTRMQICMSQLPCEKLFVDAPGYVQKSEMTGMER